MAEQNTRAKPRQRAGGSRSRTGCANCRKRRVKCDERSPRCRRCEIAQLHCEGCGTNSPEPSASSSAAPNHPLHQAVIPVYALPSGVPGGPTRRKALHYFSAHAVQEMRGFVFSDFWSECVLRRAFFDPVIQDAVIAVSYAHHDYTTLEHLAITRQLSDVARDTYSKAMRKLRQFLDNTQSAEGKIVTLICCYLFYAFELMQGRAEAARMHLTHALQLLRGWRMSSTIWPPFQTGDNSRADFVSVLNAFQRLELTACIRDHDYKPTVMCEAILDQFIPTGPESSYVADADIAFTSLIDAEQQLFLHMREVRRVTWRHKWIQDVQLPDDKRKLELRISTWLRMLTDFEVVHGMAGLSFRSARSHVDTHERASFEVLRVIGRRALQHLQALADPGSDNELAEAFASYGNESMVRHLAQQRQEIIRVANRSFSPELSSAGLLMLITSDSSTWVQQQAVHLVRDSMGLNRSRT